MLQRIQRDRLFKLSTRIANNKIHMGTFDTGVTGTGYAKADLGDIRFTLAIVRTAQITGEISA